MKKAMTLGQVDAHPLLSVEIAQVFRALLRGHRAGLGEVVPTPLRMSEVSLRAAARDYAREDGSADLELRRAAVLYVYEALRACPALAHDDTVGVEGALVSLIRCLP